MEVRTPTPWRISCSTGSLYHLPLGLALALIRDAGFAGVEFVPGPESLARGMAFVARTLARSGLVAYSMHPPLYRFPGWPREQIAGMRAVIEGAERLGCELGVIHAPKARSMATPRALRYMQGIQMAEALARHAQIAIGLETTQKPLQKTPLIFDDLAYFIDFVHTHDLSVTLDTCHAGANGDDLIAVLGEIGLRLRNIHLSDVRITDPQRRPQTHLPPGTGNRGDLGVFVQALAAQAYRGLITLEVAPPHVGLWPPRTIVARLAAMRAFVAGHLSHGTDVAPRS